MITRLSFKINPGGGLFTFCSFRARDQDPGSIRTYIEYRKPFANISI